MFSILLIIFICLLVILGGDRGVISLITLACNLLVLLISIFFLSIGTNSILVCFIAFILVGYFTIIYQNGTSAKTLSAFFATLIILSLMMIIVYTIGGLANSGGLDEIKRFSDDFSGYNTNININMRNIIHSMIIIGLSGALMDVSFTLSSSLQEVASHNLELSFKELFFSGIKMGMDVMGSTINTLFFAYMGEGLLLFVFYKNYISSFVELINSKSFFQEVSSILFSCMGCVLIVPTVSLISSFMIKHPNGLKIFFKSFFSKHPMKK